MLTVFQVKSLYVVLRSSLLSAKISSHSWILGLGEVCFVHSALRKQNLHQEKEMGAFLDTTEHPCETSSVEIYIVHFN